MNCAPFSKRKYGKCLGSVEQSIFTLPDMLNKGVFSCYSKKNGKEKHTMIETTIKWKVDLWKAYRITSVKLCFKSMFNN